MCMQYGYRCGEVVAALPILPGFETDIGLFDMVMQARGSMNVLRKCGVVDSHSVEPQPQSRGLRIRSCVLGKHSMSSILVS